MASNYDYHHISDGEHSSNQFFASFGNTTMSRTLSYSTGGKIAVTCVASTLITEIVSGNLLVILAILKDDSPNPLTCTIQNRFLISLAIADLCVGLLIMPLSLVKELLGYWFFGSVLCVTWLAIDVLLCTASIWNLCMISLDRYWSVMNPINYSAARRMKWAKAMIFSAWFLSLAICIPSLIGWQKQQMNSFTLPQCYLSEDLEYVLCSSCASFYVPLVIIVFVYIRLRIKARSLAYAAIGLRSAENEQNSHSMTSKPTLSDCSRHEKRDTQVSVPTILVTPNDDFGVNSPLTDGTWGALSPLSQSLEDLTLDQPMNRSHTWSNTNRPPFNAFRTLSLRSSKAIPMIDDHSYDEMDNLKTPEGDVFTSVLFCDPVQLAEKASLDFRRKRGVKAQNQARLTQHLFVPHSPSFTSLRSVCSNVISRFHHKHQSKLSSSSGTHRKERIARMKERRATLVVTIVVAVFITCWFPFFAVYIIDILYKKTGFGYHFPDLVFNIFFWLGYCNSGCNPIIYTIFNRDFQRSFRKLCGLRRRGSKQIRVDKLL